MHPFDVSKENEVDDPCIKHGIFLLFTLPQLGHSATVVKCHNVTVVTQCHPCDTVPMFNEQFVTTSSQPFSEECNTAQNTTPAPNTVFFNYSQCHSCATVPQFYKECVTTESQPFSQECDTIMSTTDTVLSKICHNCDKTASNWFYLLKLCFIQCFSYVKIITLYLYAK